MIIHVAHRTAAVMAGTVMSSEALSAVLLTYFGGVVGSAIFPVAFIPLCVGMREDRITNKLNSLDPTITYKQANDMHKLVIQLQDKHPDPGHYETRHSCRTLPNGDVVYEKYLEFVEKKNEMEPCAKFLLEKYQSEVAKDRMPSFETILKRLKKSIIKLEHRLII